MENLYKTGLLKNINKSLYSDGVRINVSHQSIFNPPTSINYTKRGSAREITVIFNNKKFIASYRYEGQKDKSKHLESIRFRKDLREEFKNLYPEPIGKYIIALGKNENEFLFIPCDDNEKVKIKKIETEEVYYEGKEFYKRHRVRERNQKVIKNAKELLKKELGKVFCQVCGFDFNSFYGERGVDFIEGHHKKFVSKIKQGEVTKVEDIALVCSNCHRMLHRSPYISVDDLKKYVEDKEKSR